MAAGRGQRMAPLTDYLPKPMAPLWGSTLIAHGIKNLSQCISQIHITVGYRKAALASHVIESGAASVFCTEGHGNAWWLYHTLLKHLDQPIYVLTCDNISRLDFDLLEQAYFEMHAPACMLVPVKPVAGLEGDYIFHHNGVVLRLSRQEPADIYCSGIQILNPAQLNRLTNVCEDFSEVWAQLIAQRQLTVSKVYPKQWISIDTSAQLESLSSNVANFNNYT